MSSGAFFWPMAACAITGLALYVTRGVLDQTVTAGGVMRFAMLPPWQALLGFTCLAGLVLLTIDHLNAPKGTSTATRPQLRDLVLPMLALAVLLLPYLPVIPDRWPALQALAGPLGSIVWLCVIALQVWVLWQSRLITAKPIERWRLTTVTFVLFAATLAASAAAAGKLTRTPLFPSGDEPHYLVMAQSLWRDGDLQIENNHARGDYREYYDSDLEPHYLTRGADQEIYSIHPVGIAVLMAPVYGVGGYGGVVAALIVMAALALAIGWRWTVATLNAPGAATFAWAAIALTAPFLLNTFAVYPEIAAALCVMFAFVWTLPREDQRPGISRWIAAGIAIAALPWLSTKYAPMSAALLLVVMNRLRKKPARAERGPGISRNPKAWAVVAIYAISLTGWFLFFYAYWGTPLPTAPYGSLVQTSPLNLRAGAPGLLFDQEYGLLALAPVYVLAITGLVRMGRAEGPLRREAIEITFICGALLATVGAFGIWWGGSSAPGRPIVSGLPLLMLPIAVAFRAATPGSALRAAHHLLLWISIGMAITMVLAQDGLLINNARDGSSALLDYWSPRWQLWSLAPTFIALPWTIGALQAAWWLAVAGGAAYILSQTRTVRAGASALIASAVLAGSLIVIAMTMPLLPAPSSRPPVDLSARSRLAALDGFDARVRPAAMLYDPLRRGISADVVPSLTLGVKAMQRTDRQPVRVIHNGRFSLPAGTYRIDVTFNANGSGRSWPLSLQLGRVGPPFETWSVQPQPNQTWSTTVWLPVNASFVGLRGPADLERAIDSIAITPTAVVDAGARPIVPVVTAAAHYGDAHFYFHDDRMYPEDTGFWTLGRRTAEVTVAVPPNRADPVVLRIHPGAKANSVTFSTFDWHEAHSLFPGQAAEIELPRMEGGVVPLTITVEDGFSPQEGDPASTDARFLGIWIEVKQ
jgi:hypothetical protein